MAQLEGDVAAFFEAKCHPRPPASLCTHRTRGVADERWAVVGVLTLLVFPLSTVVSPVCLFHCSFNILIIASHWRVYSMIMSV